MGGRLQPLSYRPRRGPPQGAAGNGFADIYFELKGGAEPGAQIWRKLRVFPERIGQGRKVEISFRDRGLHQLKGVPKRWRLYRVEP
jgi:hypothetical protein